MSTSVDMLNCAIVSHKNCPDGAASVMFARLVRPDIHYFFGNHIEINDLILQTAKNLTPEGTFWITDICCDEDVLQEVFDVLRHKKASLKIFEHHVSRSWVAEVKVPADLDFKVVFDLKPLRIQNIF